MSDDDTPMKIRGQRTGPYIIGERDDLGRGLVHTDEGSYALIKGVKYPPGSPEYIDVAIRIRVLGLGWQKVTKDIKVAEN